MRRFIMILAGELFVALSVFLLILALVETVWVGAATRHLNLAVFLIFWLMFGTIELVLSATDDTSKRLNSH